MVRSCMLSEPKGLAHMLLCSKYQCKIHVTLQSITAHSFPPVRFCSQLCVGNFIFKVDVVGGGTRSLIPIAGSAGIFSRLKLCCHKLELKVFSSTLKEGKGLQHMRFGRQVKTDQTPSNARCLLCGRKRSL